MLGELWETLRRALQPNKCQGLQLQSSAEFESLPIGDHDVPRAVQMAGLATVASAHGPGRSGHPSRLQQAWKAWWASRSLLESRVPSESPAVR